MSREWRLYLRDMLTACRKVLRYTHGVSRDALFANGMLEDAVLRNLTIIGEAAARIPEEARRRHASIEWRKIVAFRNIAMHEYFGLDRDIVWDVVSGKVPELERALSEMVRKEGADDSTSGP